MSSTITIDGVTIELTKEQVEKLKKELGVVKKSFFTYGLGNIANYCTNKELLTKRAKEEVLNRLLWRLSMENGGDEIDWNGGRYYKIEYNKRCYMYC